MNEYTPEGWALHRLKYTVASRKGGIWGEEPRGGASDVLCVRVADFDRTRRRVDPAAATLRFVPDSSENVRTLQPGDLLIEKSGGGDLQPVGTVVLFDRPVPAVCSNFIERLTPAPGCVSRFLCYLHQALYEQRITVRYVKQTTGIQNLDIEAYLNHEVALPPCAEQTRIAVFLDRETTKIDALVEKKERLITLLEERRAALINRAVTKGLDPNAPMKDSGIPWLGKLPPHWQVIRMKYLTIMEGSGIQMGPFGTMLTVLSSKPTPYRLYGQENTISGDFAIGDRWIAEEQYLSLRKYALVAGDIVLTRKGSIGKARVVPDTITVGIMDSDTIRVRVESDRVSVAFLVRLLHEAWYLKAQIEANSRGAILAGLNSATIGDLQIALPPLPEQTAIGNYLSRATGQITAIIAKTREQIAKFQEYRTALISAAVTGKIDVRELVEA